MKKVKRIIAVMLVVGVLLLIGYTVNTCDRLTTEETKYFGYGYYSYDADVSLYIPIESKGQYNGEWLNVAEYSEGVLILKNESETEYKFVMLDTGDLFDLTTNEILFKVMYYD